MHYKNKNKRDYTAGYTIIETMIAVSLFIIIVMAGMGALLNANLLHSKSQDMRSIIDNLSFVMEDMSRNLRTGYNYHCIDGTDFTNLAEPESGNDCDGISFKEQSGLQWVYYIDEGVVWKSTGSGYDFFDNDDYKDYIKLTYGEIEIDGSASYFEIKGAEPPPNEEQPYVTIKLIGEINYKNLVTPFSLQTSVSQRNIDI